VRTFALLVLSNVVIGGLGVAQTGTYTTFGAGCKGSNAKVVSIVNVGVPTIGKSFRVEVRDALPNSAAALITGASITKWLTASLPMDLTIFGAPGCKLYVSFDALSPTPTGPKGVGTLTASLPNVAALVGLVFHQQYFVLDLKANALAFVFTGGATGKVGK
jgi:hypothetical protein